MRADVWRGKNEVRTIVLCIDAVAKVDFADSKCAEEYVELGVSTGSWYSSRGTGECMLASVVEDEMR